MIYEEIPRFDRSIILEELNSDDPQRMKLALLSTVLNGDDYNYSLEMVVKLSSHKNEYLRACAIECLGHLSRLYLIKLDKSIIDQIIGNGKEDASEWVRQKTMDALEDIKLFESKK